MYRIFCDNLPIHDPVFGDPAYLVQSPCLTQAVNTADSLTFTIYPTNRNDAAVRKLGGVITAYDDEDLIFRGRVLNEKRGWLNQRNVVCESDFAFFNDTVVRPYTYTGSVRGYVEMLVAQHNSQEPAGRQFAVRNVTVTDPNNYITRANENYPSTMEEMQKKLVDLLGGYLLVEYLEGALYLDYLIDSEQPCTQKVQIAQNMLSFEEETKGENVISALIPLGAKNEDGTYVTIESVNGGADYIVDQAAAARYGLIFGTHKWDDVTQPANLLAKAQAYLRSASGMPQTIEIKAVDLHQADADIERMKFFTYIGVEDEKHNASGLYLITKKTTHFDDPAQNTITFGKEGKKLSQITGETEVDISDQMSGYVRIAPYQEDKDRLIEMFTSVNGGRRIEHVDEHGTVYEVLYIDTDSEVTAVHVVRINSAGVGVSNSGVNGPYTILSADISTMETVIAAQINADRINVGTICDAAGNFYLNMETGLLNMQNGIFSGSVTTEQGNLGGWLITQSGIVRSWRIEYDFDENSAEEVAYLWTHWDSLTDEEKAAAIALYDVNHNGELDIGDATTIARIVAGGYTYSEGVTSINPYDPRATITIAVTGGYLAGNRQTLGAFGLSGEITETGTVVAKFG